MSRETLVRAQWVLPIVAPPIHDGGLLIRNGRIAAVGAADALRRDHASASFHDLREGILLPGLVNAHTHLSLTALAPRIPRLPLLEWLARVTREMQAMTENEVRRSVREGLDVSWRAGTVALGEITTRPEGVAEIAADRRFFSRVYFEFLGVSLERAERRYEAAVAGALSLLDAGPRTRPGLSPHAPYSVWPTLWQRAAQFCREKDLRWSTHVAESPFERAFLVGGRGPLREHLERLGVWDDAFPVPGVSAVSLWSAQGLLDQRALLVHGLHLDPSDLDAIAAAKAHLCLCPRSNARLGLPPPPVASLLDRGIRLCLGTDSLASNEDLSVWGEMRAMRELCPDLPGDTILRMATLNGALALGLDDLCGSLRPGIPANVLHVEATQLGAGDPVAYLLRNPIEARVRILDLEA
jgi:aminodeoxyfutalosine deaminase